MFVIMYQCVSNIDTVKSAVLCGSVTYISWSVDFAYNIVMDLNYFYTLKMALAWGICAPSGTCSSCVKYWFLCIFRLKNAKTKESV